MKKLFIALSLSLGFSAAMAQTTTTTTTVPIVNHKVVTDGPVITFDENKFDFGIIKEGEVVKHTFKFRNTGNQPLFITEVRVTCGCTTPDWTKTMVSPGQTGFITAQFNSTGKPGQNNKVVTVISNSVTGNAHISFMADVTPRGSETSSTEVNPSVTPVAATSATHKHQHTAEPAAKAADKVKK